MARKLRCWRARKVLIGRIVRLALDAVVPGAVVVGAVLAPLAVRVVVLLVVRDEIAQREAVVRGDEVDRRERVAPVAVVEIARPREAPRELGDARLCAPEVAHRVSVHPVPLGPQDGEVADLVPAGTDVPRLRDQLHLRDDRILVDRVEERRQAVDLVELACKRRGEVEAEAVDVALEHEVAQRVHDQPEHRRMRRVERVAGAGEVLVVARRIGHQPVVGRVVDAAEGEHRPEVVSLRSVVVDDVEDHLDARTVERLHHALELAHLLASPARRGIEGVRGEEADRRVAPVVRQPEVVQEPLVGDVVNRQQLDGGDAERTEVRQRLLGRETGIRAAQVVAHARMTAREPFHVHLVDDGVGPRGRRRPVVLPVEVLVDDDALGDRRRVVVTVRHEIGVRIRSRNVRQGVRTVMQHRPLDRLRIRVDQQLVRIEAVADGRVVRTVHAIPVALPRTDAAHIAMPVERGSLGQLDPRLAICVVEQAELDATRVLREEREVRAAPVRRRTEGERLARPDLHLSALRRSPASRAGLRLPSTVRPARGRRR